MKKLIILVIPILLLTGCTISFGDNPMCDRKKCEEDGGTYVETTKDCICIYDRKENNE